jgi:hypothetical protein
MLAVAVLKNKYACRKTDKSRCKAKTYKQMQVDYAAAGNFSNRCNKSLGRCCVNNAGISKIIYCCMTPEQWDDVMECKFKKRFQHYQTGNKTNDESPQRQHHKHEQH